MIRTCQSYQGRGRLSPPQCQKPRESTTNLRKDLCNLLELRSVTASLQWNCTLAMGADLEGKVRRFCNSL